MAIKAGFYTEHLPVDFETEPDVHIADFRLSSIHSSGRILRWHVLARTDFAVEDLMRKVVERSQITATPITEHTVMAEVLHWHLHRILDPSTKLSKFKGDEVLVVYEVPLLNYELGQLPAAGEYLNIACHPRFARRQASFFHESDLADRELTGLPLLIRTRPGITQKQLYALLGPRLDPALHNFSLFLCPSGGSRELVRGGNRLDPLSEEPLDVRSRHGPWNREAVVCLAVEWPAASEPAPFVLQQAGGIWSEAPEHFGELFLGVDVQDFVRQIRMLRQEQSFLRDEIQAMQHWNAKISTAEKLSAVIRHDAVAGVPGGLQELEAALDAQGGGGSESSLPAMDSWSLGYAVRGDADCGDSPSTLKERMMSSANMQSHLGPATFGSRNTLFFRDT